MYPVTNNSTPAYERSSLQNMENESNKSADNSQDNAKQTASTSKSAPPSSSAPTKEPTRTGKLDLVIDLEDVEVDDMDDDQMVANSVEATLRMMKNKAAQNEDKRGPNIPESNPKSNQVQVIQLVSGPIPF